MQSQLVQKLKESKTLNVLESAPAGFDVLEEDDGEKPEKKIKINIKSDLEEKKRRKRRKR